MTLGSRTQANQRFQKTVEYILIFEWFLGFLLNVCATFRVAFIDSIDGFTPLLLFDIGISASLKLRQNLSESIFYRKLRV